MLCSTMIWSRDLYDRGNRADYTRAKLDHLIVSSTSGLVYAVLVESVLVCLSKLT